MSTQFYQQTKQNIDINLIETQPQKNIKKSLINPLIQKKQLLKQSSEIKLKKTAYITDSDDDKSEYLQQDSQFCQIKQSPIKQCIVGFCQIHQIDIKGYYFCVDCYQYKLCHQCFKSNTHKQHMILSFDTQHQTKNLTKQFLIQKIQQSLVGLKKQQNQISNRGAQINLVLKKVHELQSQLIDKIQNTFLSLEKQIKQVYQMQQKRYFAAITKFYQQYNQIGDQIRNNLLSIIEENYDLNSFNLPQLLKSVPLVPNFQIDRFKSTLDKTKKFYKTISQSVDLLTQKCQQSVAKQKQSVLTKTKKANRHATQKYEKYLTQNCFANENQQENKHSILRILNTFGHGY